MKNIMFICMANTCTSVMAEGLLKKLLNERSISDVKVYSSGLRASKGEYSPDEAIIIMQNKYQVDILQHKSINVKEVNLENMDLILCSTHAELTTLEYMYPNIKHKIFTIKEYAYGPEVKKKDIKDPWGYPIEVYEDCGKEVYDALFNIVNKIEEI